MSRRKSTPDFLPPVVFVHVWKASELVDCTTRQPKFDFDFRELITGQGGRGLLELPFEWDTVSGRQVTDNLVASHPCYDIKACGCLTIGQIYTPLISHLEEKYGFKTVHLFAYDWHRQLDEHSHNLEAFLQDVAAKHESKKTTSGGPSDGMLHDLALFPLIWCSAMSPMISMLGLG